MFNVECLGLRVMTSDFGHQALVTWHGRDVHVPSELSGEFRVFRYGLVMDSSLCKKINDQLFCYLHG